MICTGTQPEQKVAVWLAVVVVVVVDQVYLEVVVLWWGNSKVEWAKRVPPKETKKRERGETRERETRGAEGNGRSWKGFFLFFTRIPFGYIWFMHVHQYMCAI